MVLSPLIGIDWWLPFILVSHWLHPVPSWATSSYSSSIVFSCIGTLPMGTKANKIICINYWPHTILPQTLDICQFPLHKWNQSYLKVFHFLIYTQCFDGLFEGQSFGFSPYSLIEPAAGAHAPPRPLNFFFPQKNLIYIIRGFQIIKKIKWNRNFVLHKR